MMSIITLAVVTSNSLFKDHTSKSLRKHKMAVCCSFCPRFLGIAYVSFQFFFVLLEWRFGRVFFLFSFFRFVDTPFSFSL